jgi:RimJ/RimL family protein N-acetyltransferase
VEEQSTSAMIGRIGLWNPEGWPQMEVGWTLRRAYWGQGFAVEAAQASIDYAVTVLKEHHLLDSQKFTLSLDGYDAAQNVSAEGLEKC